MKTPHSVLILIFLAISFTSRAQDSLFFYKAAQSLGNRPVQEKVYLHLDKPNYSFGDTIWYKAYTVIGQHHQLSALSGVLYVELISPKDSLITRQMLPLVSGISWSDMPLPYTLKQGTYRIRAYTRWMENEGPQSFYDQKVDIGGATVIHGSTAAEKPDVQFFPESGELVNGVRSRIAIKAVGTNGLGIDVKGNIEDNTGTVVVDFATAHLGMGEFAFVPEAGKSYRARVQVSGETSFMVGLPKAQEIGYTLTINNSDKDSVYFRVATNEAALNQDKGKSFYIVAQSNGNVYYTTQGKMESTAYTARVAKSRFPMGITQFTLFDQADEPLAERLVFINNKEGGELKLDMNAQTLDQKTKISLSATDPDNKPRQGSFSVSVINESKVLPSENDEGSILNNLLLTSELKGFIEQPNYYFTHISEKTEADLDNLMLTQGYRRYEWNQILTTSTNKTTTNNTTLIKPERSQEINGTLTTPGGKPVPNGKVTMMGVKDNLIRDTLADEQGRFMFDNLAIKDTATLVVRARKMNNGSNVIIKAIPPEYPKVDARQNTDAMPPADTTRARQQSEQYAKDQKAELFKNGKVLKEVKITGFKRKPEPDLRFSSNLNGPGHANQVVMWSELGSCIDLADCLRGRVFGVSFTPAGIAINNRHPVGMGGGSHMTIIVDGMILGPGASLNDFNANDVYSVEVLRSGVYLAIYGSNAPGGAIIITMKRGGEGTVYFTQTAPNGIVTIKYGGFYKSKAFYIPKYQPKDEDRLKARTTIYWNPNILTDQNGKAALEYFNPETKGNYRVIVEGIDDDGNLGRAVYRYNIQ